VKSDYNNHLQGMQINAAVVVFLTNTGNKIITPNNLASTLVSCQTAYLLQDMFTPDNAFIDMMHQCQSQTIPKTKFVLSDHTAGTCASDQYNK